jgi:putative membrane protein
LEQKTEAAHLPTQPRVEGLLSMFQSRLFTATAMAASLLALTACNKKSDTAPADGGATTTTTTTTALGSASAPVTAAEDATSAAVGGMSAATTTTAQGFVTAAATSDMYEIQAAKLAEQKSTNPAIKKFAAKMIHDHTASTDKLKGLLSGGVSATPPTDLDDRRKGLITNLQAAGSSDFDKTYVDQQVAAHQEAVILFQGYADHGDNDALKGFATATLPTIQEHLSMAKDMQSSMK